MGRIRFNNDYNRTAHPRVLEAILNSTADSYEGYGADEMCKIAEEKIRLLIKSQEASVYFFPGATQANYIVTTAALSPVQSVICADSGHINCHEAASVEKSGHKIIALPNVNGKITAGQIEAEAQKYFLSGEAEYLTEPHMVYISFATEWGTLYSLDELTAISEVCHKYGMLLFLDGARLGYGLMSDETDVTIEYLAHNCDAFYIGGTKVGALFGEAVVFPRGNEPKHFYTMTKQHGAMLAKGWLTGLQFDVLFTDDLYFKIARNAIETENAVKELIVKYNLKIMQLSPTNQQFVIVDNKLLAELNKEVATDFWENADSEHTVIRFATSWYTTMDDVKKLDEILGRLVK